MYGTYRPNHYLDELDVIDAETEAWDTLCIVTWGAISTLVSCFWYWVAVP